MTDRRRLTDEQLGAEIGSLIRGNVESVSPPSGTFLAIQDQLGDQDRNLSPKRLLQVLPTGSWRIPVQTGMFVKIAAALVVAVAIVSAIVWQGRDTDQDQPQPATESTATAVPEATASEVPQPTAVPVATATPVPTPVVELDPLLNPENLDELPIRQVPAMIDPGRVAAAPAEDEVIAQWTAYLSNTMVGFRQGERYHFCGDGTVYSADGLNTMAIQEGVPDTWSVGRNAAMSASRWWEVNLFVLRDVYGRGYEQDTSEVLRVEDGIPRMEDRALEPVESEYCVVYGHEGDPLPVATPTPSPSPTPTAIPAPTVEPLPEVLSFNELSPRRPFPDALKDGASELISEEVVQLWTDWFAAARVAWVQGDVASGDFDYNGDLTQNPQYVEWHDSYHCGDGRVRTINDVDVPHTIGRVNAAKLTHSPAGSWNAITLTYTPISQTSPDPIDAPFTTTFDVDGDHPYQVFPGPRTWIVVAEPDIDVCPAVMN